MRAHIHALTLAALLGSTAAFGQGTSQGTGPGNQMPGPMMGPMMNQQMGPMTGPMMMGPMMGQGMMPMMGMMGPGQHIEGRLAFLKTELKITDAQAPQWNAFADAVRANAKRMSDLMGTMMSGGMMGPGMMGPGMMGPGTMSGQPGAGPTLPDRLNRAEQHLAAHLEVLRSMKGPTTQLYAALSDDQKRVADQLMLGMM